MIDEDGNATNSRWELAILKYDYPHELLYLACEDRAGLALSCYGYCNGDIVGGCQCEPLEIDSEEAAKKLQESDPFLFDAALDCIYIDDYNEWDWWRDRHGLTPPCMERGNIEDVELTHAFFLTRKSAERHIQRYYHNSGTRCSGATSIWHNPDLQRLVVLLACLDLNESTLVIDENRLTRLAEN